MKNFIKKGSDRKWYFQFLQVENQGEHFCGSEEISRRVRRITAVSKSAPRFYEEHKACMACDSTRPVEVCVASDTYSSFTEG